ncbi:MAG: acyltransferase [Chlorobiales bacterium]|jgi:predicted amidohydrolase|nr:acyltransferase [Chlorobiales bacterium]
MNTKLRIAQIDSTLANFDENLHKHISIIEKAIRDGMEFIVFPELSLTGYNVQDAAQDIAMPITDSRLAPLTELSKKISILCGGIELSEEYGVYNSAFFFEDGEAKSVHRKIYLPTYGMFEELRYFSAGRHVKPFQSRRLGKIGVAICEDSWHISVPYLLAVQGAKVIFSLMSSPLRFDLKTGELKIARTWEMLNRTYAHLFSVYVVCANRVGNEDSLSYWGNSEIVGPDGSTVVQAPRFEESIVDGVIDFSEVRRTRLLSSHFLDEDMRLITSELNRIAKENNC